MPETSDLDGVTVKDFTPAGRSVPGPAPAAASTDAGPAARGNWWWVPGAITVVTIASVIVVTLSQLHPSLLFTNTTTTGGDTGAHIAMPKFLETPVQPRPLTGWDPGWYDGFPFYTFYFTIPDLFIAVGGWIIPYDVAFKLGTCSGSVLLPVVRLGVRPASSGCGAPIPACWRRPPCRSSSTTPSPSTGGTSSPPWPGSTPTPSAVARRALPRAVRLRRSRGRYRGLGWSALAGAVLSHIVPALYALGGAVILTVVELLPARWGSATLRLRWRGDRAWRPGRTLWWAGSTSAIGLLLPGWWLVPFGLEHAYSTPMGYRTSRLGASSSRGGPVGSWSWPGSARRGGRRRAQPLRDHSSALGGRRRVAIVVDPQAALQRAAPALVVHLRLSDGRLAFGAGCIGARSGGVPPLGARPQAHPGRQAAPASARDEPAVGRDDPGCRRVTPPVGRADAGVRPP